MPLVNKTTPKVVEVSRHYPAPTVCRTACYHSQMLQIATEPAAGRGTVDSTVKASDAFHSNDKTNVTREKEMAGSKCEYLAPQTLRSSTCGQGLTPCTCCLQGGCGVDWSIAHLLVACSFAKNVKALQVIHRDPH